MCIFKVFLCYDESLGEVCQPRSHAIVAYEQSLSEVLDKISVVDLRYTNGFAVKWKKGLSADSVFKG